MSYQIHTIDFHQEDAKEKFVDSLKNTGFAVIYNHSINSHLIDNVYREWSNFFNSDIKHDYKFDFDKQDGYFPMKSENAKGYSIKESSILIKKAIGFKGELVFDTNYQDGAPTKILSDKIFRKKFPDFVFFDHHKGLMETVDYYKKILLRGNNHE